MVMSIAVVPPLSSYFLRGFRGGLDGGFGAGFFDAGFSATAVGRTRRRVARRPAVAVSLALRRPLRFSLGDAWAANAGLRRDEATFGFFADGLLAAGFANGR